MRRESVAASLLGLGPKMVLLTSAPAPTQADKPSGIGRTSAISPGQRQADVGQHIHDMLGFAQVSGLSGDTSIGDRARYDNFYIENW